MRYIDKEWFYLVSEICVNLSAGWIGAILIIPNFADAPFPRNVLTLTADFVLAIVSLIVAFYLRKQKRRKN